MSRNKKKNASELKEAFKKSMTTGSPAPKTGARWDSKTADRYNKAKSDAKAELKQQAKQSGRRADRSPRDSFADSANATVSNMSIESPVSATRSLLFPTDSASMQSFGSRTTTPGQDNFIQNFNTVFRDTGYTESGITAKFTDATKRTANACRIDVVPLFGATGLSKDAVWANPLSLAGVNLKQYIDTSFGTNTNYNPQDLMAYLLAVADIFSTIAEIKRDLRLALTVQQGLYPQFSPQGLFALLHITDNNGNYLNGEGALYTAQHLRSWIDLLNQNILAFNRLPVPPEITAFGYNDDLFTQVFLDSPDESNAQLYIFKKDSYWKYDEESNPEGAVLNRIGLGSVGTIGDRIEVLSQAIAAISALRTDSRAMLQNLYNAYGSRDTLQIPTLDYTNLAPVAFVYDEQMLISIENLTLLDPSWVHISAVMAFNSANKIEHHVYVNATDMPSHMASVALAADVPLQFHKAANLLTENDIGAALRFHASFRNLRKFQVADSTSATGLKTVQGLTADGYIGFAGVVKLQVARLQDSGAISVFSVNSQVYFTNGIWTGQDEQLRDFHQSPIFKSVNVQRNEDTSFTYTLNDYTANRDTELTYRLDDLLMHWTYLTQTVWGANLNRNTTGTRMR